MTLQEFCAAWHLSKLSAEEQTENLHIFLYSVVTSGYLTGINSDIIWRFHSGITQLTNINLDKIILPHETNLIKKKLFK